MMNRFLYLCSPTTLPGRCLLFLVVCAALATPLQAAFCEDDTDAHSRLINADELDQLLVAVNGQSPDAFEFEVFSVIDRPKKTRDELEKTVAEAAESLRSAGRSWTDEGLKEWIEQNVQENLKLGNAPRLARERFAKRGHARRLDVVQSGLTVGEVTPSTPFWETIIQPGDPRSGDRRAYGYFYPTDRQPTGFAWTSDHYSSNAIRDIWAELIGLEPPLQALLLASCFELPNSSNTASAVGPQPRLSPDKIRNLLRGEAELELRVSEIVGVPDQRIAINVGGRPNGIFAFSGRHSFATIIVDPKDYRRVYEQTIRAPSGDVILRVSADGFDASGVPREKTWERRRPDGLWEKTSYLILKADSNYDAQVAEFEFNPPPGSRVDTIGTDGWAVPNTEPSLEGTSGSRLSTRLWGLNLLAVLVLAAFTIRKFLLRRQTAAGG
jgi:hypothetical protein